MPESYEIAVSSLDLAHRRALEDVIGAPLEPDQRLIISITPPPTAESNALPMPAQTLKDWTSVYEGLSEEDVEAIDKILKTRADLTRNLP